MANNKIGTVINRVMMINILAEVSADTTSYNVVT